MGLFKKKPKIKVGQVWVTDKNNPFAYLQYTIIDIRGKYLQCRYGPGNCVSDSKISLFVQAHDLVKEAPDAD
ncbi:hypothetical protein LCGC14_2482440 [marine sediment metagenome]|uniref:Uncharacterized protein n=1 Tax=marine sediment metagenome TaxID=412755 RepID=A0A0F9DJ74_9ZZZZ